MGMESRYIWMDGKLVEFANATVHFLNVGLHYGMAVFEGIRCYHTDKGPAVFRLPEHAERLIDSAHVLGMRDLPWCAGDVAEAIKQTIAANEFDECYIRPVIWLSEGGWNINVDGAQPHLGIATWAWGAYLGEAAIEAGIRANISTYTRHHINVMMTKAKISGNYANSALAKTESVRLGFDEAIMLDPQGYVAECTGENIFVVRNGKITTPPTTTILEGVTRDSLITIARDLDYEVSEQMISRDQLYIADEVFVCGSAAECIALREIDFRTIGSGKMGPITRQIQQAYQAAIHGKTSKYAGWLAFVK
jgi:branched-chain amino acid aminotransferase